MGNGAISEGVQGHGVLCSNPETCKLLIKSGISLLVMRGLPAACSAVPGMKYPQTKNRLEAIMPLYLDVAAVLCVLEARRWRGRYGV